VINSNRKDKKKRYRQKWQLRTAIANLKQELGVNKLSNLQIKELKMSYV
jgi:hypothetical protein